MLCESAILGTDNPYSNFYNRYYQLVSSGVEEPLTTHADRFQYNFSYGIASYSKGAVFLAQLGYIIGADNLKKTIKRYYEVFKFSHPTPNDFKRIAEKVSGMQLEWYLNDWVRTTNTIDYGIQQVEEKGQKTKITLGRIGNLPMPVEVYVETFKGSTFYYYIPLRMMRGEKSLFDQEVTKLSDWSWASPTYQFEIENPLADIKVIQLNPTGLKADVNPNNDIYSIE
jgi:aminopeptidase N